MSPVVPPLRPTPCRDLNKQPPWVEENWWINSTATVAGVAGKMMLKTANMVENASGSHFDLHKNLPPLSSWSRNSALHTGLLVLLLFWADGQFTSWKYSASWHSLHKRLIVSRCLHKIRVNEYTHSFIFHSFPLFAEEWKYMLYPLPFRKEGGCSLHLFLSGGHAWTCYAFLIVLCTPTKYPRHKQSP